MAEAATLDTQPPLTPMTMRDRYVGLMQSYAALRGKPTPELLVRIADFQQQVAGLGTRLAGSDARFEAQATINYWQTVRINAGERPDTILLADFDQEAARRDAAGKPPYKGLAPYQRADSSFFVSRFRLVNDLTDMVKSKRLLALVGFSGSGKSSVVRAGLIPNLEGRAYDGIGDNGLTDSSTWAYPPPILPGADSVAALEARFKCTITAPADLVAALDVMNTAVLLTIDQFEEVFTLSDPGPRRTLFLDALVAAATTGAHRHVVVITMRKEYEGRITAHEAFNKLFADDACREVKPMQPSELRKVIEEPAQRLGVGFEPKLVDELLAQVQGEPAGLPLLSFTLLKLWDKRGGVGDMKWADYKTLGGTPRDILAKSADDVYLGFNAQQDRDLVQGIFTLLAKIGDGFEATSNRVKRSELAILVNQDSVGGAIDAVLDRLATAGLIRMAPAGPITATTDIEVAHEALIRNWGRLTGWVKDRFAQQTTRKAFTLRAEKWKERGSAGDVPSDTDLTETDVRIPKPQGPTGWFEARLARIPALAPAVARYQRWRQRRSDLLSGMSLEEAQAFSNKSEVEDEFVKASRRHSRNLQWRFWLLTAGFAALSGMLWLKTLQLNDLRNSERADIRRAELIARADQSIDRGDTLLARKLLALGLGDQSQPPPAMRATMESAYLNRLSISELKPEKAGPAKGISIADDGTRMMTLWGDGKARLWRRLAGAPGGWDPAPLVLSVPGRAITAVALSPDGRTAISSSIADGLANIERWTIPAPGATLSPPALLGHDLPMTSSDKSVLPGFVSVKFDARNRAILADSDGTALVIDTRSGDELAILGGLGSPTTAAIFAPRGDRILLADKDGVIWLYDGTSYKELPTSPIYTGQDGITSARFTNTGARFAVGTSQGNIIVYSAFDGERLMSLPGHAAGVSSIAFSPDSGMIASGSPDGTVRLWDHGIAAGRLLRTLPMAPPGAPVRPVTGVVFTADGDGLAVTTAANDGSAVKAENGAVRLIDFNGATRNGEIQLPPADKAAATSWMSISSNRKVLMTASQPKVWSKPDVPRPLRMDVWNVETGMRLMTESYSGEVLDWDLSSDGAVLAVVRDTDAKATRTVLDVWRTTDHQRIASVPMPTYLSEEGPTPDLPLVMQMSSDGSSIVMAMESGGVRTWTGGTTLTVLPIAPGAANDTASPQLVMPNAGPAIFAYAPTGKAITIHDRATGSVVARIRDAGTVAMMLFSPDGGELFVGYDTGGGAIYDATKGNILARLNGRHDNGIIDAMFSGDGRSLLTASIDSTTRVWDVDTGMMINAFASAQGVPYAEISHNGDRIITGSDGRTSTLWDVETGKVLTTLPGPLKSGNSFGWFNDKTGGAATTLSENSTLRRWNIATPRIDRDALITEACKDGGRFSMRERALNLITETEVPMCNDQRRR